MDQARVKIIAEIGVNHNGSLAIAKQLIDVAKNTGADAVKFQTFKASALASTKAKLANYQMKNQTKYANQQAMLEKLELSEEDFRELKIFCEANSIEFISSPFDLSSLEFLIALDLQTIKFASGEITNLLALVCGGRSGKSILLSTGMSFLSEVEIALCAIAWGATKVGFPRSKSELLQLSSNKEAQRYIKKNVTILHCTSEYPTPQSSANLKAITVLQNTFGTDVGFSDHTIGSMAAVASVALGCGIIEKHLTFDNYADGPDHKSSCNPEEFKKFVSDIRSVECLLGDQIKRPTTAEIGNRNSSRKGIFANKNLNEGHIIKQEDIKLQRPYLSNHTCASEIFDLLATRVTVPKKRHEPF